MTAPETPQLLIAAVPCYQDLIYLTTPEGSEQRFEKLCELMTSAIIGGAWSYGGNQLVTMEASMQVLPPLIHALGIGTARFLKVGSSTSRSRASLLLTLPHFCLGPERH
jgi:Tti2 family